MPILRLCFTNMRRSIVVTFLLSLLITSCDKEAAILPPGASLSMIAAMPDVEMLYTSFAGTDRPENYLYSGILLYNNYNLSSGGSSLFNRPAGDQRLAFYRRGDTLHPEKPFIALTLPLKAGGIYSLFLAGTAAAPDTLFTEEIIPWYSVKDSVTGLRFINLSPGSNPVTINIAGKADGSEVEALPYKSYTGFIPYPAHANVNDYTFEFRDKSSGKLLASFNTGKMNKYASTPRVTEVNKWLFRNSTLVLLGLPDGQGAQAQKVAIINHFTTR
jgi:hypothetical protein